MHRTLAFAFIAVAVRSAVANMPLPDLPFLTDRQGGVEAESKWPRSQAGAAFRKPGHPSFGSLNFVG
jgi:hypothetical protein